jgi:outer membrane protein assembly factor BamB
VWKTAVPGLGHASPCVVGNRIFIASADETAETQFLLCYCRLDGELLWRTDLHQGKLPHRHENNSHASATPACDGQAVVVPFATGEELWVSGVSLDGAILWQKSVGRFRHANGYGSSPALFQNLVIISNDNQAEPSLVALDRSDGQVIWRTPRPHSDNSGTAIVATVSGRPQLVINGANALVSYDPASGAELWRASHNTEVCANTVAFDDECVFASGNVPEKLLMAVRADGRGDVTRSHLWRTNQSNPYVPSPLVCGDLLFTVLDSGTVLCRAARTGQEIWKKRIEGTFFSSPVAAGGMIYALNNSGTMYVLRAARQYELIAENRLDEACFATPAICNGHIYIRSVEHLYCIAASE